MVDVDPYCVASAVVNYIYLCNIFYLLMDHLLYIVKNNIQQRITQTYCEKYTFF